MADKCAIREPGHGCYEARPDPVVRDVRTLIPLRLASLVKKGE